MTIAGKLRGPKYDVEVIVPQQIIEDYIINAGMRAKFYGFCDAWATAQGLEYRTVAENTLRKWKRRLFNPTDNNARMIIDWLKLNNITDFEVIHHDVA